MREREERLNDTKGDHPPLDFSSYWGEGAVADRCVGDCAGDCVGD